jgi:hypothetical protein
VSASNAVTTPSDGRAATQSGPDVRSIGEVARSLVRYLPFIVVVALLAGVGVGILAKLTESSTTSKSRIMLTSRVVWPYYDAIRDQQVELISKPETFAEIARRIADTGQLEKLTTSVPTGQAFVDIVATASSADAAIAAANAAADYLVEVNQRDLVGQSQTKHDAAVADLATLDADLASMTKQLNDLEPQIVALQTKTSSGTPSNADLVQLRLLENQRASLLDQRSSQTYRRGNALGAVDTTTADLRNTQGQVSVLRRAFQGATDPGRTKGLVALAAIAAGFLATLAAIGYDAGYQRIRSRRHALVGAARGLPVISANELGSDTGYVNRILEVRAPGETLGVASVQLSSSASARAAAAIAGVLARSHTAVLTLGESFATTSRVERLSLADVLVAPRQNIGPAVEHIRTLFQHADHVHVEIDQYLQNGGTADGAEGLRAFLDAAREVASVIVVDCGTAFDDSSRWRSFAGVCDVMVLLAEPGETRQNALRRAINVAYGRPIRQIAVSIGSPQVVAAQPLQAAGR